MRLGPRRFTWRDAVVTALFLAALLLAGLGARQMNAPFAVLHPPAISLSPAALPGYALRTTLRMLAALLASLVFTFTYATLAAKSRRGERILIPLLDVMQSVPILGYLSFTVLFFVTLAPGNVLGPELAAIFAIFTSQAWNMAFSFYQSLRTIPRDLEETAHCFRLTAWQRFWQLEVPFAMPGLVWNMMMSMSGAWFFVVASEAIAVGHFQIALPGIGSYVAQAIAERDLGAIGWAIAAMALVILLYDQLLFRPLVAWADKFRAEDVAAQVVPKSWVLDLYRRAPAIRAAAAPIGAGIHTIARARMALPAGAPAWRRPLLSRAFGDVAWYGAAGAGAGYVLWRLVEAASGTLTWRDVTVAAGDGGLTLLRVAILIVLAAVVWVPIGTMIGLRPRLAGNVQAIAQFAAAFPANLMFPLVVFVIVRLNLSPTIWLSPLMILGTQWYILFNVVAGASAVPTDFREAAVTFHVHGWRWWRDVMLPAIFPYFVTGAITASGGAWNASIVAEAVSWGSTRLSGGGLGAYIAQMTEAGDFPRVGLGVATMSVIVVVLNRVLWRPLYAYAERRTRLG